MSEQELAPDSKALSDEEKNDEKGKKRNADKNKKSTKKGKNQQAEENGSATADDENIALKGEKVDKSKKDASRKTVDTEDTGDNGKIPLLDQPVIVEGTRNRKPVLTVPVKVEVSKSSIEIPHGTGTPLGKIPLINTRLKRLALHEIKDLHRFVFGKLGNVTYLVNNLQKFNGFTFQKNSDQYNRKLTAINKFQMGFIKSLSYLLDLDFKLRKKDELSKGIINFLLAPKVTESSLNPQGIQHPKRKATKRDYFEKDIEGVDNVKRKKKKSGTKTATEGETENAAITPESKPKSTKSKGKEQNENTTDAQTDNEDYSTNTSELKKPAKKRKRNQVIDEEEHTVEEPKTKRKGKSSESVNNRSASDSETDKNNGEELSDEELKDFLKKVLADANLEKTTMKTVYNLISTHYPKYNFTDKKDFIKGVVKSLIQS